MTEPTQRQFMPAEVTALFGSDKMATPRIPSFIYAAIREAASRSGLSFNRWIVETLALAAERELDHVSDPDVIEMRSHCTSFRQYLAKCKPAHEATEAAK